MITITLEIPDEYVEVIQDLGYDVEGYYKMIFDDLEKRHRVKVEKEVIDSASQVIDDLVDEVKKKSKVKK